jgi:hypothetical protein
MAIEQLHRVFPVGRDVPCKFEALYGFQKIVSSAYQTAPAPHGPSRAAPLWLAERINALVQPSIRIS